MADTFRVTRYFEDESGNAITASDLPTGESPAAITDLDDTISWVKGTHIGSGYWAFNVPSGYPRGYKWGLYVSPATYSQDSGFNGGSFGAGQKGFLLAPGMDMG